MRKLLLLLVTVALLTACIAGCGGGDTSTPTNSTPNSQSSGKTKLVLWETSKDVLFTGIADYESEHEDVSIVMEAIPDSSPNLLSTMKMAIGAGTAPDMLCSPSDYMLSCGKLGYTIDLTPYGAAEIKDLFTETCWNAANADPAGKIYSLPFDSNIINFMYNRDMLDAVGVSVPTTLDEMKNVANKIKAHYGTDSGKWAYTGPFDAETTTYIAWGTFHYYWYLWRMGGDVFNADLTECTINSPEAVEALQLLVDFKNSGFCDVHDHVADGFWAGNVAMANDVTIWFYQGLASSTAANYGVAVQPVLKEGVPPYTGLGLYCYAITSQCKHPQEAFDFLKFYCTNEDYQIDYCKPLYFIPSLKHALEGSYFKTDDWKIILEQNKYAKATPGVEGWKEMDEAIYRAIEAAMNGTSSAKDALDAAYNTITSLMQQQG
ncbi:MAG: sugar ABC transporter substrate-binding protein [Clostridia bacterium]|nr:sugar ABC transporter substrate-binding protein [Clostridia bacterium]